MNYTGRCAIIDQGDDVWLIHVSVIPREYSGFEEDYLDASGGRRPRHFLAAKVGSIENQCFEIQRVYIVFMTSSSNVPRKISSFHSSAALSSIYLTVAANKFPRNLLSINANNFGIIV